jgi:tetratricopeptide (TPR) repeat protein
MSFDYSKFLQEYIKIFLKYQDHERVAYDLSSLCHNLPPKLEKLWLEIFEAKSQAILKQFDAAIRKFQQILVKFEFEELPLTAKAYIYRSIGLAYMWGKKHKNALRYFNKNIMEFGHNNDIGVKIQLSISSLHIGMMQIEQSLFDEAVITFSEIIDNYSTLDDPLIKLSRATAELYLGISYFNKPDGLKQAETIFDSILETYKNCEEQQFIEIVACAMFNKGVIIYKSSNSEANKIFEDFVDKFGKYKFNSLGNKFFILRLLGQVISQLISKKTDKNSLKFFNKIFKNFEKSRNPYILEAKALFELRKRNYLIAANYFSEIQDISDALFENEFSARITKILKDLAKFDINKGRQLIMETPKIYSLAPVKNIKSQLIRKFRRFVDIKKSSYKSFNGNIWEILIRDGAKPTTFVNLLENILKSFEPFRSGTHNNLIWRGAIGDRPLSPSLFRQKKPPHINVDKFKQNHMKHYKIALRGLPDYYDHASSELSMNIKDHEDDALFWAFAQHYGCFSPILDWSLSAYEASYFTFSKSLPDHLRLHSPKKITGDIITDSNNYRMLYALNTEALKSCTEKSKRCKNCPKQFLKLFVPETLFNLRVVAQMSVLLSFNKKIDLETILKKCQKQFLPFALLKIIWPESLRPFVLRTLNNMNINARTLFPDLLGAAQYANLALEIENYDRLSTFSP